MTHCWHQEGPPDYMGSRNVKCCHCGAMAVQHAKRRQQAGHGPHAISEELLPIQYPEACHGKQSQTVELMGG